MSTKEKPREFWIIEEPPYSTWVSDKPLFSADTKEEIHVIEKSAYDAVVAERDKLKDRIKKFEVLNISGWTQLTQERDRLRAALEKCKEQRDTQFLLREHFVDPKLVIGGMNKEIRFILEGKL